MRSGFRSALPFLLVGLAAGILLVKWQERGARPEPRVASPPPVTRTAGGGQPARLTVRGLRIVRPDSSTAILWAPSAEGSPAMWMTGPPGGAALQMGVHGNGFPFVLVSDGAIRSFGLGRVDGRNASPILVYRSDDVVRMVFGLGMTEAGQPPFLVHYTADGRKHDYLGRYCDAPSRVCTE
jgi:hypothetical protein